MVAISSLDMDGNVDIAWGIVLGDLTRDSCSRGPAIASSAHALTQPEIRVPVPLPNTWEGLSKLSTLSEPSIVKFIENQSEHLSKLTLYHLKKRATSRIPL